MKNHKTKILIGLGSLIVGTSANAVTLFADTFDRPDSPDLNASTAGKSGNLGPLPWVEVDGGGVEAGTSIAGNQFIIGETGAGAGWAIAYPNHNFTDSLITTSGQFTVSIDLVAPINSSGGTRFLGFAVGHSQAEMNAWSANNPTSFDSDFFFGYDTTGTNEVKIFTNGGTQAYQQGINLDTAGATLSVTFSSITDFNLGSSVSYDASIDGTPVNTGTFTWSGNNENYLGLYSNYTGNQGLIDNFEVTSIPEPTALSLAGLAAIAFLRRRR